MSKINWSRLILGGIVAAAICFLTDGLLHEMVLKSDWLAVFANLGAPAPTGENPTSMLYFGVFELGRGMIAIFIYVTMRSLFSPGPRTAVLAGVVAWIAFSLTGPVQFIPLGFISNALWIKMAGIQLFTTIIATLAGAALYKDQR